MPLVSVAEIRCHWNMISRTNQIEILLNEMFAAAECSLTTKHITTMGIVLPKCNFVNFIFFIYNIYNCKVMCIT